MRGERRLHFARAGVGQEGPRGETTPLSCGPLIPAWAVVRDFRLLARLAGVLCDVRGLFHQFGGGAFSGDAFAVLGAFGGGLFGVCGIIAFRVAPAIGVPFKAALFYGLGEQSVKAWAMIAEGLGFGPPAVGGVRLGKDFNPDG